MNKKKPSTKAILEVITKSKKKPQHSIPIEELSIPPDWTDALEREAYMFHPGKLDWKKRVIFTMNKFFDDPNHLIFEEFPERYRIRYKTLEDWCEQHEDIAEAKRNVMRRIAVTRKKTVYKAQPTMMFKDLHVYEPKWKEVDKYHADLKVEEANKGGIVYVQGHVIKETKETE